MGLCHPKTVDTSAMAPKRLADLTRFFSLEKAGVSPFHIVPHRSTTHQIAVVHGCSSSMVHPCARHVQLWWAMWSWTMRFACAQMHLTVDPVRQMYAETLQNTAKSSSGLLGNAASIEVGLLDAELCPASTPWSWYSAFDWSKMNCIISDQLMCHDVSNLCITILKTTTDAVVTIMRIYTLQIQNRSFSRVCSNTGVHTKKTRGFPKPHYLWRLYCCLEFHARSSPACRCGLFPGKAHRFLHSWPWVGWYNHAFLHITSSNFQKVMCFLPMPLSKSLSNLWKSSEISTI